MTCLKSRQKIAEDSLMSSSSRDWKFLMTTAFLVATVGVPTLGSLIAMEAPSPIEENLVLKPLEQKTRSPASLPHIKGAKKHLVIEDTKKVLGNLLSDNLISYNFSCDKIKPTNFKVEGAYLQLKGKDCSKSPVLRPLNITNKTNGFTASVFVLNKKEYQTDLIQLKEGENQISIQYQTPSGEIEEHILKVKAGSI